MAKREKRAFSDEWVRAVNEKGGFGKWSRAVSYAPGNITQVLQEAITYV